MKLSGNTILVTGGNSGIGRGLAEALHRSDNRVIVAGRNTEALNDVVSANPGMSALLLDQGDPGSISRMMERVRAEWPQLNVLVNNAGIQKVEDLTKGRVQDAEEQINVNLLGPIRITAALMSHLLAQPEATIINVSSGLAFVPQTMTPTYSASKAAIHAYTLSLRFQLRGSSVEVVEIVPPWVQTGLQGTRGNDDRAMPLTSFISEVMGLMSAQPTPQEVLVQPVMPFRMAEREGKFEVTFTNFNQARASEFGNPPRTKAD